MGLLDIIRDLFSRGGAIVDNDRTPFGKEDYEPRPASPLDQIIQREKQIEDLTGRAGVTEFEIRNKE